MFSPKEFALKFDDEREKIKRMVEEMGAKRLVLDSTTAIGMFMESEAEIRYALFKLIDDLKKLDCTTLLIAETEGGRTQFSRFGVEEFVVDGVIALYFYPPIRCLLIKKMRGTDHDKRVHPFDITEYGIEVNPTEQILWESLNK
jgi:KaiC/GvpD/RAD55 family RecA-like ATPase